MKIVKVKGFGKFNKAVEDEMNKLMAEKIKKAEEELIHKMWLWYSGQNPDEMTFAQ